jgi:hypothetical protein
MQAASVHALNKNALLRPLMALGLLVCHIPRWTESKFVWVRLPSALIPDVDLVCSAERLQRTVTRNRHFASRQIP